jgi:CO/xanthine dehydrogenase Mo-binding subunit
MRDNTATQIIDRRGFLRLGGELVVGVSLLGPCLGLAQTASAEALPVDAVDSFLSIAADGSVTIKSGKVDLGTGARIAYRQMVAEELDVLVERVGMVEGDTALTPDQGGTGGSTGVAVGGVQLRQAAATARQALLLMAAKHLGAAPAELMVDDGTVRRQNGAGGSIGYGELVAGKRFELSVDRTAPLKDPATYRVVGRALPRPDLPAKLTGQHTYVQDFRLPGMLHARIIRPASIGASLAEIDERSVTEIPDVQIVRLQNFLAVLAPSEWNAVRAQRQLRVRWTGGGGLPGSERLFAAVRGAPIDHETDLVAEGDSAAALKAHAERSHAATYEWPAQSHASMGPSCAVAQVTAEGATIWTASQATHHARFVLAQGLGLPPDKVRLVYLDGAGCYGMNGHDDAAAEAALLARETGKPVRVQWMREDEHGWDPKGPPQLVDFRAALDENGAIAAWESEAWLPVNTPKLFNRPLLAFEAAGIAQQQGNSSGLIEGNSYPDYAIPNRHARVHWLKTTPLRPSNLRAPGKPGNVFAVESFVDELAAAAKIDPIDFRLRHLGDAPGRALLLRLAERMQWQSRPAAAHLVQEPIARGRGVAYVRYKHIDNRIALGVEAEVERSSGKLRVKRIVCVCEVGLMINPDALRAQVEGNLIQATSRTLFEEVIFDQGGVTSTDWASYPILTFPDLPIIEIELVGSPHDRPLGAGEATTAPVPAAIGNAVFDAIGVRLRRVPLTPERVRAGLADKRQT